MKAALIEGARKGQSAVGVARRLGVDRGSLAIGALEVIRDLSEQPR